MIGNNLDTWTNEVCDDDINYGGSVGCDILGRFVGLYKIIDYVFGHMFCCIPELVVYTTINIAPYSQISFEGTS